jgi:hypothetical protein
MTEEQWGRVAPTEAPAIGGAGAQTYQEHKAAKTKKPAREGKSITVQPLSRDEREE